MEPEKYKTIRSKAVRPIKQNGKWTTIVEEFDEVIPDLGRENDICNICGWPTYPECKEWCRVIKPRES